MSKDTLLLSVDLGRGLQIQSELPASGRYFFLLPIAGHEKFRAKDTKKRLAQEKSCLFVKSFGSCKDLDNLDV